jgi:hypothetical protein
MCVLNENEEGVKAGKMGEIITIFCLGRLYSSTPHMYEWFLVK